MVRPMAWRFVLAQTRHGMTNRWVVPGPLLQHGVPAQHVMAQWSPPLSPPPPPMAIAYRRLAERDEGWKNRLISIILRQSAVYIGHAPYVTQLTPQHTLGLGSMGNTVAGMQYGHQEQLIWNMPRSPHLPTLLTLVSNVWMNGEHQARSTRHCRPH